MPKHQQVVIKGIRLGHALLTSSYLLNGNEFLDCECGNPLTVEHVLVEYQFFNDIRRAIGLERDFVTILLKEKIIFRVINFLNILGLYKKANGQYQPIP